MAAQQEIAIGDDELDALMAELDAETAGAVVAPAPVAAAPAPAAESSTPVEDEMAALEAELEAATAAAPVAEAKPAPTPAPAPEPAPAPTDADAEMAALEAELNAGAVTEEKLAPAAPEPTPAPAPKPTLAAVPDPDPAPVAHPNPPPKKEPAALQFFIDVAQFRDETRVSDTNLDNCMMQQAGLRAYYAEQAARAEAQHARLKARFDVLEAQLYDQHRKALTAAGEKVTEKAVENAVKLDPKWLKNKNVVIEAETIANVNRGLVESLKDRKDMLVQLGADRREEGKGQLRIMAAQAAHGDVKDRAMRAAGAA